MPSFSNHFHVDHGPHFGQLMETYADNYRRLGLLFDDSTLERDRMISRVEGQLPLYIEITERHSFTTCARISHAFESSQGIVSLDPDAHIRIYHDAKVAEATHCYPGTVNQPLFGALVPVADVVEHRWRMNRFLDKWLEYLLQQGHNIETLSPAPDMGWPLEAVDRSQQAADLLAEIGASHGPASRPLGRPKRN